MRNCNKIALSVTDGILGVGDRSRLGKLGKPALTHLVGNAFLVCIVTMLVVLPFITGNSLQVIVFVMLLRQFWTGSLSGVVGCLRSIEIYKRVWLSFAPALRDQ